MKVRCTKLLDEQTGGLLQRSSWLTVGKVYHVLSVHMQHGRPLQFQLMSDEDQTPAYHHADQFDIVTRVIPEGWIIDFESESYFELVPKAWSKPGFLEAYFDGDPEAISIYKSECEKIMSQEK